GKAALHSEPLMSHIHRQIAGSGKQSEKLLNLYGKIRKGVAVSADLGSPLQRRLLAVGLLQIDDAGELRVRNRIYAAVFTARWANENLSAQWRAPAAAILALAVIALVPFWYTQWLPTPYARVLTSTDTELPVAEAAWFNLRSFPMHSEGADNLYRQFLIQQARDATDRQEILAIAEKAETLPGAGSMPEQFRAEFWDRQVRSAIRLQQRDAALIASLHSLILPTPARRNRSAMLIGDDYPALLASVTPGASDRVMLNPETLQVTATSGSTVSQWAIGAQGATRIEDWTMTALEVSPLVRRVVVVGDGTANRVGLTLSISHSRFRDLRIKVIAPSGRAVEVDPDLERASVIDRIRIPGEQLEPLIGEALNGTWSISIRDEATGIAGYLDGWTLTLNAQVLVEDFQRGIGIPDPVEREAASFWISKDSRYAVARATQSDSARLWDLAFGRPLATLAITENETLIGVDGTGRYLVTATLDSINLWDIASGKREATLASGPGSDRASLTADGRHLVVQNRSDVETGIARWQIDSGEKIGELTIAGVPALVAYDAMGQRVATADYDRAARLWDLDSGELVGQFDLPYQPSDLRLSAAGDSLAAVFGRSGISLWSVDAPETPLLEHNDAGDWQVRFSPSGARVVVGRPDSGFDVHATSDGRRLGPTVGAVGEGTGNALSGFNSSEDVLATRGPLGSLRFWQLPVAASSSAANPILQSATDAVVAAIPGAEALLLGDRDGHVHRLPADAIAEALAAARDDVSFLGHNAPVRSLQLSPDGALAASVAADGTLRIWEARDGLPRPYVLDLPAVAGRLAFSPDNSRLGVLTGSRLSVIDLENGNVDADIELGEPHTDLAFGANGTLYLGSGSGSLNVVTLAAPGAWTVRRLWQGEAPIRLLELSPRERFLVVVDANRLARQFELADGRMGERSLVLPSDVQEISFSPNGSRVVFRTARWAHRVGSSTTGLIWLQAILVPRPLANARIVYDAATPSGQTLYLPIAGDGLVTLAPQRFDDGESQGLFGKRQDLLAEWGRRLDVPIFPASEEPGDEGG
ncbi:MAG: proprotein convertase P-domain-containing protein, partial [Pseudomonadota bacterium]